MDFRATRTTRGRATRNTVDLTLDFTYVKEPIGIDVVAKLRKRLEIVI